MNGYKQHLIRLLLADRVGPVFVYRALSVIAGIQDQSEVITYYSHRKDELESALEVVLNSSAIFLASNGICSLSIAEIVKKSLDTVDLGCELDDIQANNVSIDTCFDDEYPDLLKNIYAPPVLLYRKGRALSSSEQFLSVVGSRASTAYGLRCVAEFLPSLANAGWNLVSGGALGIDTAVHKVALEQGSATTVILGAGLLNLYPYCNKALFERILANGGTLLAPFSMKQRPERGTFPARNRIIAGISRACLVIEASEKSGALITASYALESGRTVCAVPGSVFSETSVGCHKLLKQGAVSITSVADLLEELGCNDVNLADKISENTLFSQNDFVKDKEFFVFIAHNARSEEEIADFLKKTIPEVQDFLFDLQLEGKIKQHFTGLWGLPA
jgi:DNA processing protein